MNEEDARVRAQEMADRCWKWMLECSEGLSAHEKTQFWAYFVATMNFELAKIDMARAIRQRDEWEAAR